MKGRALKRAGEKHPKKERKSKEEYGIMSLEVQGREVEGRWILPSFLRDLYYINRAWSRSINNE